MSLDFTLRPGSFQPVMAVFFWVIDTVLKDGGCALVV